MSFIAVALLLLPSFPPPPSSSALLLIRIPHWPYSFNPVANTSPLLVTTRECAPPDAIDLIFPPFGGMSTGTNVLFEDDDADDPNGIPSRKKSPFPATYASVFNVRELWFCVHFIRFFSSMEEENVTRAPPKVAMMSQS
jgi:hypothetical protein